MQPANCINAALDNWRDQFSGGFKEVIKISPEDSWAAASLFDDDYGGNKTES